MTAQGCVAVIPARWQSRRLPGKVLLPFEGQPLVERVRQRVLAARGVDRVVVATDDDRVEAVVRAAGGEVLRTGPARNGTERLAMLLQHLPHARWVNVQCDQPDLDPAHVALVVDLLERGAPIATLATPLAHPGDPAQVKVQIDARGLATDFSRRPIPVHGPWLRHLGIYGYQRAALARCAQLPVTDREVQDDLEQLRWLGVLPTSVAVVPHAGDAIDSPHQLHPHGLGPTAASSSPTRLL